MGTPSVNWVNKYSQDLYHLLQKRGSVWMSGVTVDYDFEGEYKFYNQLDSTTVNQRTSRNQDTQYNEADHERRRVSKTLYTSAELFDTWDEINMNLDPTSRYSESQLLAMGREIDNVLRTAALGTAYTGKAGGTATSFDTSNQVVTAGSGLTYQKILETLELFNTNNVPQQEEKYFAIGPKQLTKMLESEQITSSDYVGLRPLMAGEVVKWGGFNFILDTELTTSGNDRYCVAWAKSGIMLAMSRGIQTRVSEMPNKNYAKQIYSEMALGAVRMEEEKVVRIDVDES